MYAFPALLVLGIYAYVAKLAILPEQVPAFILLVCSLIVFGCAPNGKPPQKSHSARLR
jgi:hypothetical protein